jgi:hypothetical protein
MESFRINAENITQITRTQADIFGAFGCSADPIPTMFNGNHSVGLTPPTNPSISLVPSAGYIQPQFSSNCSSPFGIGLTGWSELAFRPMLVEVGDIIAI